MSNANDLNQLIDFAKSELISTLKSIKLDFKISNVIEIFEIFERESKKRIQLTNFGFESHEITFEIKDIKIGKYFTDKSLERIFYFDVSVKNNFELILSKFRKVKEINLNIHALQILNLLEFAIQKEIDYRNEYFKSLIGYKAEEEIIKNQQEEIKKITEKEPSKKDRTKPKKKQEDIKNDI